MDPSEGESEVLLDSVKQAEKCPRTEFGLNPMECPENPEEEIDEMDFTIINEITESNWVTSAKCTLNQYFNRGGDMNGDEPQLITPPELINNVGYALSIVPNVDPTNWDKDQLELAYDGRIAYYQDKALETIKKITKHMNHDHGIMETYLTILPISFYFQDSFYTLPLFRFKKSKDEAEKFVDNVGRVYSSFDDWHKNNRLPACKILYPKDGKLSLDPETQKAAFVLEESAEFHRPVKTLLAADILYGTMGVLGGIGATVATGGAALLMMGAVGLSATYGATRSALKLKDRAKHKETINPFYNKDAFFLWLGISFDVLTFGTIGAASAKFVSGISTISTVGHKISTASRISQVMSALHGASKGLDGASILVTGLKVFEEIKHKKFKTIPASELLKISDSEEFDELNLLLISITAGFWSKSKMSYCTPEQFRKMILDNFVCRLRYQCKNPEVMDAISSFIPDEQILIELFKHLGLNLKIEDTIEFLYKLFKNNNNVKVTFDLGEKTIAFDDVVVPVAIFYNKSTDNVTALLNFLLTLTPKSKEVLLKLREYFQNDLALFKFLGCKEFSSVNVLSGLWVQYKQFGSSKSLEIDPETMKIIVFNPDRFEYPIEVFHTTYLEQDMHSD